MSRYIYITTCIDLCIDLCQHLHVYVSTCSCVYRLYVYIQSYILYILLSRPTKSLYIPRAVINAQLIKPGVGNGVFYGPLLNSLQCALVRIDAICPNIKIEEISNDVVNQIKELFSSGANDSVQMLLALGTARKPHLPLFSSSHEASSVH